MMMGISGVIGNIILHIHCSRTQQIVQAVANCLTDLIEVVPFSCNNGIGQECSWCPGRTQGIHLHVQDWEVLRGLSLTVCLQVHCKLWGLMLMPYAEGTHMCYISNSYSWVKVQSCFQLFPYCYLQVHQRHTRSLISDIRSKPELEEQTEWAVCSRPEYWVNASGASISQLSFES